MVVLASHRVAYACDRDCICPCGYKGVYLHRFTNSTFYPIIHPHFILKYLDTYVEKAKLCALTTVGSEPRNMNTV